MKSIFKTLFANERSIELTKDQACVLGAVLNDAHKEMTKVVDEPRVIGSLAPSTYARILKRMRIAENLLRQILCFEGQILIRYKACPELAMILTLQIDTFDSLQATQQNDKNRAEIENLKRTLIDVQNKVIKVGNLTPAR